MIKLLATTILSLSILGGGATSIPIQQTKNETQNEIHIQTQTENLTNIQWHNNSHPLAKDKDSLKSKNMRFGLVALATITASIAQSAMLAAKFLNFMR